MPQSSQFVPMAIIGLLFFIFGFVTWLNGSLIPFLKVICDLSATQALFVTFAFYIAYTITALPISLILSRTGYKKGMALGLSIMVLGSLTFIPASIFQSFALFLMALFIMGTGLTLLQTASNPYVIYLGPKESAAMRISIMGIINKAAGIAAPLLFTALILSDFSGFDITAVGEADKEALAQRLITPYIYMAALLSALVALLAYAPLPELEFEGEETPLRQVKELFQFPHLVLGAIALFFYVGVEVVAGDTIGLFGQSLGVANATSLTAFTMSFMVMGYTIGVFAIPRLLSQEKALLFSALGGIVFTSGIFLSSSTSTLLSSLLWGWMGFQLLPDAIVFVALLGLANALVWPTIWPLALEGLGRYTAQGSALLIMGIAGGALLPLVFGQATQLGGSMQFAYVILIPAYLFIVYYALRGHKVTTWKKF